MEIKILNRNFETLKYMNVFKSLEWVKRYYEVGDFILSTASKECINALKPKNYIVREDDDQICVIENVKIETSAEKGNEITVSGRSIECLLSRRIIWSQTTSKANETAESYIRRIINENCINPTNAKRKIPRLKLGPLKGYTEKIEIQKTGDNLLKAIIEICQAYEYGFKIFMDEKRNLVFDIYKGVDRSYNQKLNSYVVFSDDYGNIVNTEYEYDESNISNVALIGGEGEGIERKYQTVGNDEGMDRYELFVDAKDISSNNGEITTAEYNNLLIQRGNEKIAENTFIESYAGEVETTRLYKYKQDFDLGDNVEVENENAISSSPRIIEVIESENEAGYRVVPTFGIWEV